VDVHDFGIVLNECSASEIKNSMRKISGLPTGDLKLMSKKTWEFARANHTRQRFAAEYRKIIETIISIHNNDKS
jgi:hypothetical protein